jgi:hypothetical protein
MRRALLASALPLALTGCLESGGKDSGDSPNLSYFYVDCARDGGRIDCEISVENSGEMDSGTFRVDLFVNPGGEPEAPATGDDSATVGNMAPGDTRSVSLSASCGSSCVAYLLVDSRDAVGEWDEGDNLYGPDSAR